MRLAQCQLDSYQRSLPVHVHSCLPSDDGYIVETDESIIFPGGGGQPEDFGWIHEVPARPLDSEDSFHFRFRTDTPVPLGSAEMRVDWARRFDHMQQHTAQHIITALALREFGWNTLSFHLNPARSDVVLDEPDLDWGRLGLLEDRVNEVIRAGRSIGIQEMSRQEVEAGDARYRRLPDGQLDRLRMVVVDGVDLNPCGGTHVRNTSEIQLVRLITMGTERGAQTRVHFLAGLRALRYGAALRDQAESLKTILSCGHEEQLSAVKRLVEREKTAVRHGRSLECEVAGLLLSSALGTPRLVKGLARVKAEPEFVNTLARGLQDSGSDMVVVVTIGDVGPGVFSILGPEDRVAAVSGVVCERLEGRGGGRGRRFQGKADRVDRLDEAVEAAQALLAERS